MAPSGGWRDNRAGKGRFDLLCPYALTALARRFEAGAEHYGDRNWEKGMPQSWFIDSGLRHIARYMMGEDDEDHLAAALWNLFCAVSQAERVRLGVLDEHVSGVPLMDVGPSVSAPRRAVA